MPAEWGEDDFVGGCEGDDWLSLGIDKPLLKARRAFHKFKAKCYKCFFFVLFFSCKKEI